MAKRKQKLKKNFNLLFGSFIFMLLIGSAFAVDWIFGILFIIGFGVTIYTRVLEKKPLIPLLLFIGGLIIRIGLSFIPSVLEAKTIIDFGISIIFLVVLIIVGVKIQKGKI